MESSTITSVKSSSGAGSGLFSANSAASSATCVALASFSSNSDWVASPASSKLFSKMPMGSRVVRHCLLFLAGTIVGGIGHGVATETIGLDLQQRLGPCQRAHVQRARLTGFIHLERHPCHRPARRAYYRPRHVAEANIDGPGFRNGHAHRILVVFADIDNWAVSRAMPG